VIVTIGVHRTKFDLHLEDLLDRDITIKIEANDGTIWQPGNFLLDDDTWRFRLIADNKSGWRGQHVVISPCTLRTINWPKEQALSDICREQDVSGPPWTRVDLIDEAYQHRLHCRYDWFSHGW
jgi:hypothetical protein